MNKEDLKQLKQLFYDFEQRNQINFHTVGYFYTLMLGKKFDFERSIGCLIPIIEEIKAQYLYDTSIIPISNYFDDINKETKSTNKRKKK